MPRLRPALPLIAIALAHLSSAAATEQIVAPNSGAKIVNQLSHSGNACGPAALLSAFKLATPRWQEIPHKIPGSTDRARLSYVIKTYGGRPSRHVKGRSRWDSKTGISLVDLTDVANELRLDKELPELKWEVLLPQKGESVQKLLKRTHRRMSRSLNRGIPPVVGLQRLAQRQSGTAQTWATVHGHFIVVTALPRKLARNSSSIPIRYADPWGGQTRTGSLRLVDGQGLSAVAADLPESKVGRNQLRKGETSVVIVSSTLGDF